LRSVRVPRRAFESVGMRTIVVLRLMPALGVFDGYVVVTVRR
jgi:hypothetical protein